MYRIMSFGTVLCGCNEVAVPMSDYYIEVPMYPIVIETNKEIHNLYMYI